MAKPKNNVERVSYISVPSEVSNYLSSFSLQPLLLLPKKQPRNRLFSLNSFRSPKAWFFALVLFCFLGIIRLWFNLDRLVPFSPYPCLTSKTRRDPFSNEYLRSQFPFAANAAFNASGQRDQKGWLVSDDGSRSHVDFSSNSEKFVEGKDPKLVISNQNEKSVENEATSDFWKQPDGLGYRPCLNFSEEYKKWSEAIVRDRRKYLLVVVSGGINQQKNQIVDAVVIARILGAALVVPILQVNVIWGDESEFYDIFDLEHFKRVLANDVRIVSSLPSTHIMTRPVEEKRTPFHVSPLWIRSRYLRRLNREGVLLLRGLDSRLSKDLPSDLQKLRCKVAFHALKFAPHILELGNKLAERIRSKGPYVALHLRMEKDVWVRTGCLPGLSPEYDEMISTERKQRPELLTARSHLSFHDRKLSGLCPLNSMEVTRLLKALGAPNDARIYWAGGQPHGGKEALLPLTRKFPHLYSKEDLALPGELEPFEKRASFMAAIDYIVSVNSDVFIPSHGGNMGHAIQGDRAYAGHKKYITPNKRHMLPHFLNSSLPEEEFSRIIKELHRESLGQPELRTSKAGRDVTQYPVPECMCSNDSHNFS